MSGIVSQDLFFPFFALYSFFRSLIDKNSDAAIIELKEGAWDLFLSCDIQRLDAVFEDFIHATGVYLSLLNEDFTYRYSKINPDNQYCACIEGCPDGFLACRRSDRVLLERCRSSKRQEIHICHAGLVDVASPVMYDGHILGYIILGQMKRETDFAAVAPLLAGLPLDTAEMERHYDQLPCFDDARIRGVANLAVLLARYLFLENMVRPGVDAGMAAVLEYIDCNLTEPLTLQSIVQHTNVSKSTLYKYFHQYYHCTVSEYIGARRLERAAALLLTTQLSIEQISQQVGFSGAAYFSRSFKKRYSLPPLQYRKQQREKRDEV